MTAKTIRARRRPVRAIEQVRHDGPRPSLATSLLRAATSRPAKTAYVVIGTVGLAALAVALIGPARIEREVIRPIRGKVEHEAERLWGESQPLREQIAGLFNSAATMSGRDRLVRSFQSWIGHFHAT